MRKLYNWYKNLSRQTRSSVALSASIISGLSVVSTVLGVSLGDLWEVGIPARLFIVIALFLVLSAIIYLAIGSAFKESIDLPIRGMRVTVKCGDIFKEQSMRVIACDNHFDTRVDDVVINEKSLHGQLIKEHGDKRAIEDLVESEAKRLGISRNQDGQYDFPLGAIIKYESKVDDGTYLMLAMNELDDEDKAYTDMAMYEQMLMNMWKEIDRVYATHDVALPVLGGGTTRFRNGPQSEEDLLRCMLCTLNASSVVLKSKISIILYDNDEDVSLYELRDLLVRRW